MSRQSNSSRVPSSPRTPAPPVTPAASVTLKIAKLVFGGQGLAHAVAGAAAGPGRTFFVWGGLPGETVEAVVMRRRGGVSEARVVRVVSASADRVEPREAHYLSCSPWQCLSVGAEREWKIKTAQEALERIGHVSLPALELTEVGDPFGYRNKMEFSFVDAADAQGGHTGELGLRLAFFERATHQRIAIDGCALARPEIAKAADAIVTWLGAEKVSAKRLKSLVIRTDGKRVIAGLFCMDKKVIPFSRALDALGLSGFVQYYSDPRSPVSRADETLNTVGSLELEQKVDGKTLQYGLESFFQVNVPVFEQALTMMREHIEPTAPLVDLYSGVGSIGISLASPDQSLTLVENNPEAINYAEKNAKAAGLQTGTIIESPTERALHAITRDATICIDPPRAGMHAAVVQRLNAVRPAKIVYLSCNVSTQARDLALLAEHYKVQAARLFNFFPRTPHVESLVVLKRR